MMITKVERKGVVILLMPKRKPENACFKRKCENSQSGKRTSYSICRDQQLRTKCSMFGIYRVQNHEVLDFYWAL